MAKVQLLKKASLIKFGDLKKSDVFKHGDDPFMKILIDERRKSNAINLTNATFVTFNDTDEVDTDVRIVIE